MRLLKFTRVAEQCVAIGPWRGVHSPHRLRETGEVEFGALLGRGNFFERIKHSRGFGARFFVAENIAADREQARETQPRLEGSRIRGVGGDEGAQCAILRGEMGGDCCLPLGRGARIGLRPGIEREHGLPVFIRVSRERCRDRAQ